MMEEEKATSGEAQAPADDTSGMLQELFGSDSEGDDQNGELNKQTSDVDMKELFGSDDEDIVGEGPPKQQEGEQGGGVAAVAADKEEEEEEGGTRDEVGPMHIEVELRDALPLSQLRVAKLPNSLRIEPDAFEREDFKGDDFNGPVIRWRYELNADGKLFKESNARVVTWSDGSKTLSVGKDVFQVRGVDVEGDHTFLYVRHGNLVQCEGKFKEKFLFNPIGISRADRPKVRPRDSGGPKVKVKQTATLVDPVKEREMKEKMEEARIKDKEKLQEKQKQHMRRSIMQAKVPPRRQSYLSAAFLEEDDDMPHEGHVLDEGEEDDGFIVPDDDEGVEDVDEEDIEDVQDVFDEDQEEQGAARLEEIKKGDDMPKIEDKEPAEPVEESDEEMNVQPKKRRAVVMESDSE